MAGAAFQDGATRGWEWVASGWANPQPRKMAFLPVWFFWWGGRGRGWWQQSPLPSGMSCEEASLLSPVRSQRAWLCAVGSKGGC